MQGAEHLAPAVLKRGCAYNRPQQDRTEQQEVTVTCRVSSTVSCIASRPRFREVNILSGITSSGRAHVDERPNESFELPAVAPGPEAGSGLKACSMPLASIVISIPSTSTANR